MPKRSAEEMLVHYQRKIRKIKEKVKKRRRIIESSDSSDVETIEETTSHAEYYEDIMGEQSQQPAEMATCQTDELQLASPPPAPPPSQQPQTPDPTVEQGESGNVLVPTTPPMEALLEPPLDPELLSALGAGTSDTPDFGESIHNSLANLWPPLLCKGLSKEDKDYLTKEYLIPSNCKLLQAPKLNAEISAAVSEIVRGRDKKLTGFQQELGTGIAAINRGMDMMLKTDNKALALKSLSDGCRLLSNVHYGFTKDRTKLIIPSLEKSFLHVIQDTERDDTLFGNSLAEKIKACKAIERQGHQIRNKVNPRSATPQILASRPAQQGNWIGPPRYLSSRGGRGGRGRAVSTAARRNYPPTKTQTTTKSTNQSKTRANVQQ